MIKIWDIASETCLQTLAVHTRQYILSVAFSPDGSKLVSAADDNTVKVWDMTNGTCLQTLTNHSNWVNEVKYSSDGERMASASDDGTDPATVNENNIYILDTDGQEFSSIKVELANDNRSIVLTPQRYYWTGQRLYLYISPAVKSASGRALSCGIRMPFTVQSPGTNGTEQAITREYRMANDGVNWNGGFADLPVDGQDIYELSFDNDALIEGLEGAGKAVFISGHNRSDDLFMFIKRQLTTVDGLEPNTTYSIQIETDLATNVPAGLAGIGGAPGESVFVKVGASTIEPQSLEEDVKGETPYFRMNVDKGTQNDEGQNAVLVGNVAKVNSTDPGSYEIKTLTNTDKPLYAATDDNGKMWIFVGTDSGFEGKTDLYYTRVHVTLTPWEK